MGGSVAEWLACWRRRARVQIAAATLSGNSLRQTVHTHRASVHQAAKLVAALLRIVGLTAGLAESDGSLPSGLWFTSPAGWLPRTGISSGTLLSVIEYGLPLLFLKFSCIVPSTQVSVSWRIMLAYYYLPTALARKLIASVLSVGLFPRYLLNQLTCNGP